MVFKIVAFWTAAPAPVQSKKHDFNDFQLKYTQLSYQINRNFGIYDVLTENVPN